MKSKKMADGGTTNTKPKKGFLAKGEVPSPDEGYRGKRHLPVIFGREKINSDDMESQVKDMIHKGAEEDYKKEAGVQDSIKNPLVRGARKAATYVKEKYGDIRDDVRTAVTGDDTAKYRGMQRGAREGHLGYSKGGSVKSSASSRADGAAQRGRTKGRTL